MAITLIKENLRNPMTNTWIPLREIEGDDDGNVTAIKQLGIDEYPLNYVTPEPGVMVPSDGTEVPVIPYPIGYKKGEVTPIKTTYIFQDGSDVSLASPLALFNGTFVQETPATALKNLKIDATQTKDASVIGISSGGTGSASKAGAANSLAVESLIGGTAIAENDDLNDYNTVGNYYSSGSTRTATLSNIPDGLVDGFQLKVKYVYGNYVSGTNYLTQELISNNGRHYSRGKATSDGWGAWAKTYTTREIVAVEDGGTGASTAKGALNNLGITWGEKAAPSTGTPNTIYIQLLPAEE